MFSEVALSVMEFLEKSLNSVIHKGKGEGRAVPWHTCNSGGMEKISYMYDINGEWSHKTVPAADMKTLGSVNSAISYSNNFSVSGIEVILTFQNCNFHFTFSTMK